ncbi:OprD family outer membrane porin [Pseudomonas putida]|uniref:OprD family outer membrane porin n=1 Tax=Pseudomonas putida TaxID=303 RepID=UPI0018A9BAFA|nr:OprD family outer membrane porin [Pseudomonas putida]MBF8658672.1 outer membrane porin, OprD family [Pseudomonas putida]
MPSKIDYRLASGLGLALACQQGWADEPWADVSTFLQQGALTGVTRNFYLNRDFRNGGANRRPGTVNGYRAEWAQGLTVDYTSAFTPGLVGLGVDAHMYAGLKLDSGHGKTGTNLLHVKNDGEVADEYSVGGGAFKLKVGETVLRYGSMELRTSPVFLTDGGFGRLLPQTVTAWQLTSRDLQPLTFDAAHITAGKAPSESRNDSTLRSLYGATQTNTVDYLSLNYEQGAVKGYLSTQRAEDLWRQDYLGFRYLPASVQRLTPTLNISLYRTVDIGAAHGGPLDNLTWSFAPGVKFGPYSIMLAYQKVQGDTPFDYLAFRDGQTTVAQLANNVQLSDFNAPNDQSWQVRCDYDFAARGVPGLKFMIRYMQGRGGKGSNIVPESSYYALGFQDGGRHWERNIEMQYVVQSGPAKNLSLRARYGVHRGNAAEPRGDMDEIRLITELPFTLL